MELCDYFNIFGKNNAVDVLCSHNRTIRSNNRCRGSAIRCERTPKHSILLRGINYINYKVALSPPVMQLTGVGYSISVCIGFNL